MENNELFRKKTLDRISSPDEVKDYIHVVRPGVWILLIVLLLLIAAGIIWAFTAKIDVQTAVNGQNAVSSVTPISFLFNS